MKQQVRTLPSESRLRFLAEEVKAVAEFVQAEAACRKQKTLLESLTTTETINIPHRGNQGRGG